MASNPQITVSLGCFALEFEPSASPTALSQDTGRFWILSTRISKTIFQTCYAYTHAIDILFVDEGGFDR
ncbi:uncharacterized protein RSE6_06769 [Rhynchosporium secalis]|uniref:Uncharacterized protein n=1 Tax=Rhynchosporium secalis TaxID=38038 RepID=A0A1E1MB61_RHYSE|nr:uncharacterized protein RSE6_06769 [Rhynchosporium secalis]